MMQSDVKLSYVYHPKVNYSPRTVYPEVFYYAYTLIHFRINSLFVLGGVGVSVISSFSFHFWRWNACLHPVVDFEHSSTAHTSRLMSL